MSKKIKQPSKRNKVKQEIILKDGSKKVVFHEKETNNPQYGDRKNFWNSLNTSPKLNSKRQIKLRETAENLNSEQEAQGSDTTEAETTSKS